MASVIWLCFKLPSCLFDNTKDTSVMHKKAIFVCFIHMQPQKVKFKSVYINMKQVSYIHFILSIMYAMQSPSPACYPFKMIYFIIN